MIDEVIVKLGEEIDKAFSEENDNQLRYCIEKAESLRTNCTNPDDVAVLEYFMGNGWSNLDKICCKTQYKNWDYKRVGHINAIKSFRKCVLTENVSDGIRNNIFLQAFTNLGNMFSESGRIVYAIECWKKALKIEPTFGMAGCNFGHGLVYYASYQYDANHAHVILRDAYKLLQIYSNQPNIPKEAQSVFNSDIEYIEKILSKDYLLGKRNFKEYSLGKSKKEKQYRKWILENGLYLNPLNDLFYSTAIAHDVTSLPNMLVKDYDTPVYQGFFNQIKQEYLTARYLYYHYKFELSDEGIHYSDNGRHLVDTLDYPQHGYRYEQLKNSFKMLYSIFDKIGYFINEYFKLGIDRNKVYFKNVWYENGRINPKIEELENNPLRGLYFLSKDLFTENKNETEYVDVTDPEANRIYELRNNLEHKYCKIHWFSTVDNGDLLVYDSIEYSITEEEFAEKTYKLLRYVREAILYLSLSVHTEERKDRTESGVVLPLHLFEYD